MRVKNLVLNMVVFLVLIRKLTQIHNKYNSKVQISFLWDKDHLLNYKDSPIDQGPDVFIQLFKNRIQI